MCKRLCVACLSWLWFSEGPPWFLFFFKNHFFLHGLHEVIKICGCLLQSCIPYYVLVFVHSISFIVGCRDFACLLWTFSLIGLFIPIIDWNLSVINRFVFLIAEEIFVIFLFINAVLIFIFTVVFIFDTIHSCN